MRIVRICITALLMVGVGTAAFAGDLREAAERAGASAAQETPRRPVNTMVIAGTSLFVAGMAIGLYGFINNKNGDFSEFGEAQSSNKPLGAIGLSAAFAGGTLMFLGRHRARHAPSVSMGADGVSVAKTISW
jgi:hypothetical protein